MDKDWKRIGNNIKKTFEFEDFKKAIKFINKIAEIAEREAHHPDITLYNYNKVEVKLTTHSVGDVTEKDFKLASEIDNIRWNSK